MGPKSDENCIQTTILYYYHMILLNVQQLNVQFNHILLHKYNNDKYKHKSTRNVLLLLVLNQIKYYVINNTNDYYLY